MYSVFILRYNNYEVGPCTQRKWLHPRGVVCELSACIELTAAMVVFPALCLRSALRCGDPELVYECY